LPRLSRISRAWTSMISVMAHLLMNVIVNVNLNEGNEGNEGPFRFKFTCTFTSMNAARYHATTGAASSP